MGIDGCKSGWVALALGDDGEVRALHLRHIAEVNAAVPDAAAIGIDIPIRTTPLAIWA